MPEVLPLIISARADSPLVGGPRVSSNWLQVIPRSDAGKFPVSSRFTGYPEVEKVKPAPTGPVAGADKCNSTGVRWHNLFVADVNIDDNAVLRLRICGHAACRALFTICVSCDRGQRYCSPECRSEVRRQRHDANCRYQQSDVGWDSHRRCQQRYRERASKPPVADQGLVPITSPAPPRRTTVCQCASWGRHSLWIDPFPCVPRRFRLADRSKKYVFR